MSPPPRALTFTVGTTLLTSALSLGAAGCTGAKTSNPGPAPEPVHVNEGPAPEPETTEVVANPAPTPEPAPEPDHVNEGPVPEPEPEPVPKNVNTPPPRD